jgi:hypothetical protein
MVFRTVVLSSVTWIGRFVSQGCAADGGADCVSCRCADLCDMESVFCVTELF